MTRTIAIIGLILTFIVAQQNNSEYWVINRAMCLDKMASSCQDSPDDCLSICQTAARCTEMESDCGSTCAGSSDCSVTDTRPVCLQFTCEKQSQNLPCCILVHPFWGETQNRLNLTPDQLDTCLALSDRFAQIPFNCGRTFAINPDPPWGVHPIIETTVLRI